MFLAWLQEEAAAPLGDIDLVRGEIGRGEATLLVPAILFTEILAARNTPEQMGTFRKFLNRSNVVVANIDQAIAEKAGQLRSRALELPQKVNLRTPDATYLATAIIYQADVFHTLEAALLPQLSGTPVVDGLRITAPRPLKGTTSYLNPPPTVTVPPVPPLPPTSS